MKQSKAERLVVLIYRLNFLAMPFAWAAFIANPSSEGAYAITSITALLNVAIHIMFSFAIVFREREEADAVILSIMTLALLGAIVLPSLVFFAGVGIAVMYPVIAAKGVKIVASKRKRIVLGCGEHGDLEPIEETKVSKSLIIGCTTIILILAGVSVVCAERRAMEIKFSGSGDD